MWWRSTARRLPRRAPERLHVVSESLELRAMLAADLRLPDASLLRVEPSDSSQESVFLLTSFSIQNIGDTVIQAQSVIVQAVISADQVFGNADDVPIGSGELELDLNADSEQPSSLAGTANVSDYRAASFLLMKVDSTEQVLEVNENNNVISTSLPGLPAFSTSPGQLIGTTNRTLTVDPAVEFDGSGAANHSGSRLTISIANHEHDHDHDHEHEEEEHDDGDLLSFKKAKTSSGMIRRKNGELRLGKVVVGLIGGGTNSHALLITFSNNVSADDIRCIAAAVTLKGRKGVPGLRQIEFELKTATGVTGLRAIKEVILQ